MYRLDYYQYLYKLYKVIYTVTYIITGLVTTSFIYLLASSEIYCRYLRGISLFYLRLSDEKLNKLFKMSLTGGSLLKANLKYALPLKLASSNFVT